MFAIIGKVIIGVIGVMLALEGIDHFRFWSRAAGVIEIVVGLLMIWWVLS